MDPSYPTTNPELLDPDRRAVEERRRARNVEYGTYVAKSQIPWGSVIAFQPGDPVPASTVEAHGWDKLNLVTKADKPPAAVNDSPPELAASTSAGKTAKGGNNA